MVSLRSGRALQSIDANTQAILPKQVKPPSKTDNNRKRKAIEELPTDTKKQAKEPAGRPAILPPKASKASSSKPAGESKTQHSAKSKTVEAISSENKKQTKKPVERPATPPPPKALSAFDSELADEPGYERTPGRLGPIKEDDFTLSPKIKPFKGPKGNKVRKSFGEKEEEYAQFARDNEGHCFHEIHVCFAKGPSGSPTYDKSGFQLDFAKVAHWVQPHAYNKAQIMRNSDKAVESSMEKARKMADIFFEKGEAPADAELSRYKGFWKDRVSKDLNIPWHRIEVEDFRKWEAKGFKKARRGEYENPTEKERKRDTRLLSGASLRK